MCERFQSKTEIIAANKSLHFNPLFSSNRYPEAAAATLLIDELFEVRAHQIDEIFGQLGSNPLLRSVGQVKPYMRLHDFAHKAIDAAPHSGEQHQLTTAVFVCRDQALDRIELPTQSAHTLHQLQLVSLMQCHD
jgi:hypothetical protein